MASQAGRPASGARRPDEISELSALYPPDEWMQEGSTVPVQLAKLNEETRCPICFGKIKNARVSIVCLHRFCSSCIEQFMRSQLEAKDVGKECPVCRAHLGSRRAVRPDPRFDQLIGALYGDVEAYEKEEERLIAESAARHAREWNKQLKRLKAKAAAARNGASGASSPAKTGSGHRMAWVGRSAAEGSSGPHGGHGGHHRSPSVPQVGAAAAAARGSGSGNGAGPEEQGVVTPHPTPAGKRGHQQAQSPLPASKRKRLPSPPQPRKKQQLQLQGHTPKRQGMSPTPLRAKDLPPPPGARRSLRIATAAACGPAYDSD